MLFSELLFDHHAPTGTLITTPLRLLICTVYYEKLLESIVSNVFNIEKPHKKNSRNANMKNFVRLFVLILRAKHWILLKLALLAFYKSKILF